MVRTSDDVRWLTRFHAPLPPALRLLERAVVVGLLTLALTSVSSLAWSQDTNGADAVPVLDAPKTAEASTLHATPKPAATATPAKPAAPRVVPQAPKDLRKVSEWIEYRGARHLAALPNEARIFYRRGLNAHQAGQFEDALVDVRGAAELDPLFVEPHLTLAAWMLTSEPSQALLQYATVVELLRQNFSLQLGLVANAFLLGAQALFIGLLLAGILVVWLRRDDLTHGWQERIARSGAPRGARVWAWGLLALPYAIGLGLTLPTLTFLGMLWPALRVRERALAVMLLAASLAMPFALQGVARMALPLREDMAPFYGVPLLENQPYSAEREEHLTRLASAAPDDALLQFGLGWVARRGNDLARAEKAYRRALELWPANDRVLNDLGNVLAMQGRVDEALGCYQKAVEANPANAAAWFNSSQLHTQRFDYAAANDALSRASALNFELVKTYQSQATDDGLLPLVDQWLSPNVFWTALSRATHAPGGAGALPMSLRGHLETTGWPFSLLALVFAVGGIFLGIWQHRTLPLRACSNCGTVVCRRCAERRREHALCPACARVEAQAESQDFSRVLLLRHRQAHHRTMHLVRTAFAALIPGYGLLAHRRVFTAIVLLGATWLLARLWIGALSPFAFEPRLALAGQEIPIVLIVAGGVLVYAVSLLRYISLSNKEREREAALAAAGRGRITQSTRRITPIAA